MRCVFLQPARERSKNKLGTIRWAAAAGAEEAYLKPCLVYTVILLQACWETAMTPDPCRCLAVADSETRTRPGLKPQRHRDAWWRLRRTCKGAVGPDVVNDEAGSKHQQNHEQLGPGETPTLHLHLQILPRGETREEPRARSCRPLMQVMEPKEYQYFLYLQAYTRQ